MRRRLARLDGATVRPDGTFVDKSGKPTDLYVSPGGYLIFDASGQTIGTLSLAGRIYDGRGSLVSRVNRLDRLTRAAHG